MSLVTPWYVAPPLLSPFLNSVVQADARWLGILILPVVASHNGLCNAAFVPTPAAEFAAATASVAGTATSAAAPSVSATSTSATLRTDGMIIEPPVEHPLALSEGNTGPRAGHACS